MGGKKKEIPLQVNITTQELWEEMLGSKGLTVVDVYQGWCGPCKPVVSLFQRMRIEVGLDLLHFALAEADRLDVLEKFRGRCEPTFLFYLGGKLVAVVRGANGPLLQKTILHQLEAKKKVRAEGREWNVVADEALSGAAKGGPLEKDDGEDWDIAQIFGGFCPQSVFPDAGSLWERGTGNEHMVELVSHGQEAKELERHNALQEHKPDAWPPVVSREESCTLGIIKPDAVAHGKADEIIMKIQEAGFDILSNEERILTETEMQAFYQHRAGEEAFEKLVHHMCSGPSHLLILTKTEGTEDVVTAWQTFLGPCDPSVARREHPESLRAQYGTEMPFNAVHGSRDREDAKRELALLFPSLKFSDKDMKSPQGAEAQIVAGPMEALGISESI